MRLKYFPLPLILHFSPAANLGKHLSGGSPQTGPALGSLGVFCHLPFTPSSTSSVASQGQILISLFSTLSAFGTRHGLRLLPIPGVIPRPKLAAGDPEFPHWASPLRCGGLRRRPWLTFAWVTGAGRGLAVSGSSPDTRAVCGALITLMWGLGRVVHCSEEGCDAGTGSERHYRGNGGTAAPRRIHNL